jgi:RNA binding motif
MQKYYSTFLTEKQRIANLKLNLRGTYGKLEYKPNVIGLLQGVHKDTNSKIIKALVEMIVPVAYVDYQARQLSSYIRFKNEIDAQVRL